MWDTASQQREWRGRIKVYRGLHMVMRLCDNQVLRFAWNPIRKLFRTIDLNAACASGGTSQGFFRL